MIRKALLAIVILSFSIGIPAAETGALFAVAEEYNQEYRQLQLNFDLAMLRAERQRIQARDRLDELRVTDTVLSARETYRRGLESFYYTVLDVTFEVATALLRLDLAELQVELGTERLSQVEQRFQRGLASQSEVINARIALRADRRDRENARWALEEARIVFADTLGTDWTEELLPRVKDAERDEGDAPRRALEDGENNQEVIDSVLGASPAVGRAQVAAETARVSWNRLPENAPTFDRRIAEAEVERTAFEEQRIRSETERQFERTIRRNRSQLETVLIRREELALQRDLLRESERRFGDGMITSLERDQATVQVLQARIQLLAAEMEYFRTDVSRFLLLGLTPAGNPVW